MNLLLLKNEVQEFIAKNINVSLAKLALQKNPFPEIAWNIILNQIEAKTKAKEKLPLWFETKNILYHTRISIEQTSSEATASYKSNIVSGENLIDITGGFGVDDFYFSKKIKKVIHCEINQELSTIAKHNFEQLKAKNISCFAEDGIDLLKNLDTHWAWIYLDPDRRNAEKGKVFMLRDCLPNAPKHLDYLFSYSDAILIKTSPLLDITAGLSELKNVKNIHIVAVQNEVKEILWELHKNYSAEIVIKTVNILKEKNEVFEFPLKQKKQTATYSLPQKYLYEPNSAIMKSGGFEQVCIAFKVNKLHKHSHLYTSENLLPFPGRCFEIQKIIPYNNSQMKTNFENQKMNVSTRNFPENVAYIRKKWKIKDGGIFYSFFTTDKNEDKIVLICKKNKNEP